MMKKTYIKPALEIQNIHSPQLLAASGFSFEETTGTMGSGSLFDESADENIEAMTRAFFNF